MILSTTQEPATIDYDNVSSTVVRTIVETFAGPVDAGVASPSLQHTSFEIGKAVIGAAPAVSSISLLCPNIHNIPADLAAGRTNEDHSGNPDVFWATKEPFGIIKVTVARPGSAGASGRCKARL